MRSVLSRLDYPGKAVAPPDPRIRAGPTSSPATDPSAGRRSPSSRRRPEREDPDVRHRRRRPALRPARPDLDRRFYAASRCAASSAWIVDVAIVLLIGVPLAVLFGLLTLGFGFALFGFIIAAVGFLYRTSVLASPASATLGMRFTGIEFRRGNGERFDFVTALVHTAMYAVCIGTFVLQLISCATVLGPATARASPTSSSAPPRSTARPTDPA